MKWFNKKNNPIEKFEFRKELSNRCEINLIDKLGIQKNDFIQLFKSMIVSEVLPDEEIDGIQFVSINDNAKDYFTLKNELKKSECTIEMSLNIPSKRYSKFDYNQYSGNEKIENIGKQIIKIYPISKQKNFINQLEYWKNDKSDIKTIYEYWKNTYEATPIWADGNENLIITQSDESDIDLMKLCEDKFILAPGIKDKIDDGWGTIEGLQTSLKNRLPVIDLCFYN